MVTENRSIYETLKSHYSNASPEEKLQILRHELLRPYFAISTISELLKSVDFKAIQGLPGPLTAEELEGLIKKLYKSTTEIREILDALT